VQSGADCGRVIVIDESEKKTNAAIDNITRFRNIEAFWQLVLNMQAMCTPTTDFSANLSLISS
jgi:hypothetical protein